MNDITYATRLTATSFTLQSAVEMHLQPLIKKTQQAIPLDVGQIFQYSLPTPVSNDSNTPLPTVQLPSTSTEPEDQNVTNSLKELSLSDNIFQQLVDR
jgi:hypothetical protein